MMMKSVFETKELFSCIVNYLQYDELNNFPLVCSNWNQWFKRSYIDTSCVAIGLNRHITTQMKIEEINFQKIDAFIKNKILKLSKTPKILCQAYYKETLVTEYRIDPVYYTQEVFWKIDVEQALKMENVVLNQIEQKYLAYQFAIQSSIDSGDFFEKVVEKVDRNYFKFCKSTILSKIQQSKDSIKSKIFYLGSYAIAIISVGIQSGYQLQSIDHDPSYSIWIGPAIAAFATFNLILAKCSLPEFKESMDPYTYYLPIQKIRVVDCIQVFRFLLIPCIIDVIVRSCFKQSDFHKVRYIAYPLAISIIHVMNLNRLIGSLNRMMYELSIDQRNISKNNLNVLRKYIAKPKLQSV